MQCAICLEDGLAEADMAELPCCTIPPTSTTRFCRRCLEVICERATGGVGRCPNCRAFLRVAASGALELTGEVEVCTMCAQVRTIVARRTDGLKLCDACFLGASHALRYECDRCGRYQRIPHPMWRYQRTANEFGDTTWYCHARCETHTNWRVAPRDAPLVPPDDCPATWGRREEWLAAVREQRLRERAPAHARPAADVRRQEGRILFISFALLALALAARATQFGALNW